MSLSHFCICAKSNDENMKPAYANMWATSWKVPSPPPRKVHLPPLLLISGNLIIIIILDFSCSMYNLVKFYFARVPFEEWPTYSFQYRWMILKKLFQKTFHSFKFDPSTWKIYINMETAVFICKVPSKSHSQSQRLPLQWGWEISSFSTRVLKGWWVQEDNCCSWQWCRFRIMPKRYSINSTRRNYCWLACDFSRLIMWIFFGLSLQDELYALILFIDHVEFNIWILAPSTSHRALRRRLRVEFKISAIK